MQPRKLPDTPEQGKAAWSLADGESKIMTSLQNVLAHLCVTRFDDGSPRKPGRLFIETQGPLWKVTLKEPRGGLELVVVASTVDDALASADLLLGSDQCPWQLDQWAHRDDTKKKKG